MGYKWLIIFIIWSVQGFGQNTKQAIFKNFTNNTIAEWEIPIKHLEKNPSLPTNDSLLLIYNELLYGITGFYIADKNNKAPDFLAKFYNAIELLTEKPNLKSYYLAYSSAAIAYDMVLNPYKIPFLANKSFSLAYAAVKQNSFNPVAWVILGNAKYHAPKVFGGNLNESLKFFKIASKLWEHQNQTKNNWLYINTMAWAGFINYKLTNYDEAKTIYTKILKTAPYFFWVKNELLPDVEKKLQKEVH